MVRSRRRDKCKWLKSCGFVSQNSSACGSFLLDASRCILNYGIRPCKIEMQFKKLNCRAFKMGWASVYIMLLLGKHQVSQDTY